MTYTWKTTLLGWAVTVALAALPAGASAAVCGDLNNNGAPDISDALILSNIVVGNPAPGNVCGVGNVNQCGDVFGDGVIDAADLASLVDVVAGLETLFDPCTGPGPTISCPATLSSQTITSSQVWPTGCTVTLAGTILVDTNAGSPTTVLTIQPGVTVLGQKGSADPAALIILPGAKINAQGTAAQPIIMTSDQPPGSRGPSDWGGFMVNGRSTVNRPNCLNVAEGLEEPYGGCDPHDSSGIVRYLSSRFGGKLFTPNNELNSTTWNGIGDGTVVDHIQGHNGADDCIEFFGGTVHMKYAVATACADDGLDFQLGFTGSIQYGMNIQSSTNFSCATGDCRGIEADNSEFGHNDLPRSNPSFCNITLIGDKASPLSDVGVMLRRGVAGTFANMIVEHYPDAGVELRDSETTEQACTSNGKLKTTQPYLQVRNSIFFDNGDDTSTVPNAEQCKDSTIENGLCTTCEWYAQLPDVVNKDGQNTVDPQIPETYPASFAAFDGRPTVSTGFPPPANCASINEALDNTDYIGAFDPNGPPQGWLSEPWVSFDLN